MKERSVLSDSLPYEVPIIFNNKNFYRFIVENEIEAMEGAGKCWTIKPKTDNRTIDCALDSIVKLLFGNCGNSPKESIPYHFKINHKNNEFRQLSIPHPYSQLKLIEFYDSFKEMIIYYCSVSNFSLRSPCRVASNIYFKDKTHYKKLSEDIESAEERGKEYENVRSFFVYDKYNGIHKFYESYEYLRAEKKFSNLLRLDISKCFDSIYTHSLAWALLGKATTKNNLSKSRHTFAGKFDKFMQSVNHNETNGILIGPEFSRIFAEILLQSVDRSLEINLQKEEGLIHKVHYQIYRYVDDYFVFYNSDTDKDIITRALKHLLQNYKLELNANKASTNSRPFITEITVAKLEINKLLEDALKYRKLEERPFNVNFRSLATRYKSILKKSNVAYSDIVNYTLSILENKLVTIADKTLISVSKETDIEVILSSLRSIIEFAFFIYAAFPMANTTIKICRIVNVSILLLKGQNEINRNNIYKCIQENINFILREHKGDKHTQIETSYLLISLSKLGRAYKLHKDALATHFNIIRDGNKLRCQNTLNYFSIIVLVFYMKKDKSYEELRTLIFNETIKKFKANKATLGKSAELVMLLLDIISCPYVDLGTKKELLKLHGINECDKQMKIINFKNKLNKPQFWFTSWDNFDFQKELDMKQSQEVY